MILGQWRLKRSIRRARKLLRQMKVNERAEITMPMPLPKELTGVQTPISLKVQSAKEMQENQQDWVLLQERILERLQMISRICSEELR